MNQQNIENMRREYALKGLHKKDVKADPLQQFETWFKEATELDLLDASAMTLATVSAEGQPSARIVLLKGCNEDGFTFYGNYESRKGKELVDNPHAALLFYWPELERQVRIEGSVIKLSQDNAKNYFRTRPFESQVSASISAQSGVVKSREELESLYHQAASTYENQEVPMPATWGGFQLQPTYYEFWQGRSHRLHDRIRYQHTDDSWHIDRLAP